MLEGEWEKPLFHIDCAHHVDERYYSAAVGATFGDTSSPSQTECTRFKKWFSDNPDAIPKVAKYDPENPSIPHDDPFLKTCLEDLKELKARLTREDRLRLPRGDYQHLWELVQVMISISIVSCNFIKDTVTTHY